MSVTVWPHSRQRRVSFASAREAPGTTSNQSVTGSRGRVISWHRSRAPAPVRRLSARAHDHGVRPRLVADREAVEVGLAHPDEVAELVQERLAHLDGQALRNAGGADDRPA